MLTNAELKCIRSLLNNKDEYLKYFANKPEHELLSRLYGSYATAYCEFGIKLLGATPMPTKPLDAYVAGGMANGIAGIGAGVAAFQEAKAKEQKYEQAMLEYKSTLRGIAGASDELAHFYGCIVDLINTNPEAKRKLKEKEDAVKAQIIAQKKAEKNESISGAIGLVFLVIVILAMACWWY